MTKKPGSGGFRAGSGRAKGSINRKTRKTIKMAESKGRLPLEIMLDLMHKAAGKAESADKRLALALKGNDLKKIADLKAQVKRHEDEAFDRAAGASPYVHAKLQSVVKKDETLDLSKLNDEELAQLYNIQLKATRVPADQSNS